MLNKFIVFIVMFLLFISGGTRVDTTVFSSMPYDSGSSFSDASYEVLIVARMVP